ncbi:MAG: hypothetical protein Q4C68_00890 [Moraxella sp.]|nr:hypothetical protein [Moraxella sp.]
MLLINSGAYVGLEFQAEIGIIPPCMLPIGNKKLIELQIEQAKKAFPDEMIVLSIPESYKLTINEDRLIKSLGIILQPVPDDFSLAESMLYVMNVQPSKGEGVRVLHGDTFICDLPHGFDVIAVVEHRQGYNWRTETMVDGDVIWGGYFAFSSKLTLIKALATSKGNFVQAVENYRSQFMMQLEVIKDWHDCGHINTFFDTRAKITTQRSFNSLLIEGGVVTKSSHKALKMQAEINWFNALPASLKKFRPQFIESGVGEDGHQFYRIEFLSLLPLNELYVHGRNRLIFWQRIFNLIQEYFELSARCMSFDDIWKQAIQHSSDRLYRNKTMLRLEMFAKDSGKNLDEAVYYQGKDLGSISQIAQNCIDKSLALPCVPTVMHGDLCFSNMLFDPRGQRLKLIDPRGIDEDDKLTIFGNQTYDLAKLAHSVIGMYDFIIAGRYQIDEAAGSPAIIFDIDERLARIQNAFLETEFIKEVGVKQIMPAVVLLFLSMIPLHDDRPDRQEAMMLNAFRLYHDFVI